MNLWWIPLYLRLLKSPVHSVSSQPFGRRNSENLRTAQISAPSWFRSMVSPINWWFCWDPQTYWPDPPGFSERWHRMKNGWIFEPQSCLPESASRKKVSKHAKHGILWYVWYQIYIYICNICTYIYISYYLFHMLQTSSILQISYISYMLYSRCTYIYIYIRIEYASYSMFKQMYDIYKIYIRYQNIYRLWNKIHQNILITCKM